MDREDLKKGKQALTTRARNPVIQATSKKSGVEFTGTREDAKTFFKPVAKPAQRQRQALQARPIAEATLEKPEYHTKKNSPDMGWQERTARNKQLDENYRTGMRAQSSEGIAQKGNAADIKRTQMGVDNSMALRKEIESGLDTRQEGRQTFLGNQQTAKFDQQDKTLATSQDGAMALAGLKEKYQTKRDLTLNNYKKQAQNQAEAGDLLHSGRFANERQYKDYVEWGPSGVQGLNVQPPKSFSRVAPKYGKRMVKGREESFLQTPGGRFDKATGKTTYDVESMSLEEIDALMKQLENKKEE